MAEEKREEADRQRALAEENRLEAEENAETARLAKEVAVEARDREEYEAYVAGIGLAAAKIDENAYDFALELLNRAARRAAALGMGPLAVPVPVECSRLRQRRADRCRGLLAGRHADRLGRSQWQAHRARTATGENVLSVDHGGYLYTVAFSPDGQLIASGSSDGVVRLVNTSDGVLRHSLGGHEDGVLDVAFSPDGKQFSQCFVRQYRRVWDLERGEAIATLGGHNWWVWSAQFSPDSERIVTASQDRTAIVWQPHGRRQIRTDCSLHRSRWADLRCCVRTRRRSSGHRWVRPDHSPLASPNA